MVTSPFRALLGAAFDTLPDAHRAFYDRQGSFHLIGTAQVWRSRNPVAGLLCTLVGLPAAGEDVPLTLTVTRGREHWARRFGRRRYASIFVTRNGLMIEHMGWLTNVFRFEVVEHALHLHLIGCRAFGVTLPAWLRPRCHAIETTDNDALTFDIPISMPGFGPVIHYRGRLEFNA